MPPAVIDRKGEHAVESFQKILTPFTVPVQENLGIGMVGLESVTLRLQFSPEIRMVVDLAVEDDCDFLVGRAHWLGTIGKINNRKPPMPEMHSRYRIDEISLGIRPPVGQSTGHSLQSLPVTRPARRDESGNPAHQFLGRFFVSFTR